eukprot:scaffold4116_cov338-Prasinococcus_capsulatus_cf.AAC.4
MHPRRPRPRRAERAAARCTGRTVPQPPARSWGTGASLLPPARRPEMASCRAPLARGALAHVAAAAVDARTAERHESVHVAPHGVEGVVAGRGLGGGVDRDGGDLHQRVVEGDRPARVARDGVHRREGLRRHQRRSRTRRKLVRARACAGLPCSSSSSSSSGAPPTTPRRGVRRLRRTTTPPAMATATTTTTTGTPCIECRPTGGRTTAGGAAHEALDAVALAQDEAGLLPHLPHRALHDGLPWRRDGGEAAARMSEPRARACSRRPLSASALTELLLAAGEAPLALAGLVGTPDHEHFRLPLPREAAPQHHHADAHARHLRRGDWTDGWRAVDTREGPRLNAPIASPARSHRSAGGRRTLCGTQLASSGVALARTREACSRRLGAPALRATRSVLLRTLDGVSKVALAPGTQQAAAEGAEKSRGLQWAAAQTRAACGGARGPRVGPASASTAAICAAVMERVLAPRASRAAKRREA